MVSQKQIDEMRKQKFMNEHLDNSSIKDLFDEKQGGSSESKIVKEMFSAEEIKARTDVNDREISQVTRIYYLAEFIQSGSLKRLVDTLLTLKLSKKRKSRSEFIEALGKMPRDTMNTSFGGFGGLK